MAQSFRQGYGERSVAITIDNPGLSVATAKLAEPGFLEVERQRGRAAAQVISRASRAHGKLRPQCKADREDAGRRTGWIGPDSLALGIRAIFGG
jgi:hypothetical protein